MWYDNQLNRPNQPVVGVSWHECQAYCRWRSAAEGQHYHLPSEAEWEKAARGTDGRQYPWGNKFDASRLNSLEGDQFVYLTTPVGIYSTGANPYGCLDMAGNVWEWVEDDWHDSYDDAPDDGSAWVDNPRGTYRVVRGGSWGNDAHDCRSARRGGNTPDHRSADIGFRLARSLALGP